MDKLNRGSAEINPILWLENWLKGNNTVATELYELWMNVTADFAKALEVVKRQMAKRKNFQRSRSFHVAKGTEFSGETGFLPEIRVVGCGERRNIGQKSSRKLRPRRIQWDFIPIGLTFPEN